jgi:hypothetical protein
VDIPLTPGQTITVVPPTGVTLFPTTAMCPPSNEVADFINQATTPCNFPAGTYTANKQIVAKVPVTFADGSILKLQPLPVNIILAADNVVFKGVTTQGGGVVFEVHANNCGLVGVTFGDCVQPVKTASGGFNFYMTDCTIGQAQTVALFFDRGRRIDFTTKTPIMTDPGIRLTRVKAKKGVLNGKEYIIRFDPPDTGPEAGIRQSGATMVDCDFWNDSDVKNTIGVRQFDDVSFIGGTVVGDGRNGQVNPAGPPATTDANCRNITYKGVTFSPNAHGRCGISIQQGVTATVVDCTFIGCLTPPLACDQMSEVSDGNNTQISHPGQHVPNFYATSSKGTRHILSPNIQVVK